MAETLADDRPLALEDLTAWFAHGCKPASDFRVGAEHEKFVFRVGSHEPAPYDGPAGIRALMEGLMRFGWTGTYEATPDGVITMRPIASKNPAVMGPGVFLAYRYTLDGNTLTLTQLRNQNGPFAAPFTLKLARVE